MPRVNMNDLDNYNSGSNGGNFFQLKNDKETARVRFMLDDIEDLNDFIYVTHTAETKDSQYGVDVNCLREYDEPVDNCPFCAAGMKTNTKIFVPIWNEDEEKVQIWSRGKTIISKLQGLMKRYEDFPSHIFEIERNGKPKSTKTTYEIYEKDEDDTTLDDLDELPEIEGIAVKNYSAEDMEYYLEEGEFPPDDDDDDVPARRKSKSKKSKRHDDDEDVKPRKSRRHTEEPEDDEDDDDEEPERKKSSKSKKSRRHRSNEDEF